MIFIPNWYTTVHVPYCRPFPLILPMIYAYRFSIDSMENVNRFLIVCESIQTLLVAFHDSVPLPLLNASQLLPFLALPLSITLFQLLSHSLKAFRVYTSAAMYDSPNPNTKQWTMFSYLDRQT